MNAKWELWTVSMEDGTIMKLEKETHKKKNELNNWNSLSAFIVPFCSYPLTFSSYRFSSLDFIIHKIQTPNGIRNIEYLDHEAKIIEMKKLFKDKKKKVERIAYILNTECYHTNNVKLLSKDLRSYYYLSVWNSAFLNV